MANINLLPWREQLREDRKREFLVSLSGIVIIAVGILFLMDRFVNGEIEGQNRRNDYLRSEIQVLDAKVAEIRELRSQKELLTERMEVIQDLQGNRPIIVRLFDELVRTLPDGVYYNSIKRNGDSITLVGVAESNSRVSELMRSLRSSEWFTNPDLEQVTVDQRDDGAGDQGTQNIFNLTVTVTKPGKEQVE